MLIVPSTQSCQNGTDTDVEESRWVKQRESEAQGHQQPRLQTMKSKVFLGILRPLKQETKHLLQLSYKGPETRLSIEALGPEALPAAPEGLR